MFGIEPISIFGVLLVILGVLCVRKGKLWFGEEFDDEYKPPASGPLIQAGGVLILFGVLFFFGSNT